MARADMPRRASASGRLGAPPGERKLTKIVPEGASPRSSPDSDPSIGGRTFSKHRVS